MCIYPHPFVTFLPFKFTTKSETRRPFHATIHYPSMISFHSHITPLTNLLLAQPVQLLFSESHQRPHPNSYSTPFSPSFISPPTLLVTNLSNSLISTRTRGPISNQIVENEADNREEEDEQTPKQLIDRRTGRFEDLEDSNNIQNQHDEAKNPTTTAPFPGIALGLDGPFCGGKGEEEGLHEEGAEGGG